jgi:phosphoglycolate phosphatase-like HAD superfamily hydrolase
MQLFLFDVDGTLLRANGGGKIAIEHAVSAVTGETVSTVGVPFSGRTDPAIFRDVLRVNGLPDDDHLVREILRVYIDAAQDTIRSGNVEKLPGVEKLLSLLARRSDVFLGLVTGNVESIAYHKLRTVGLADYFSVGAFGSDHANRDHLPGLASNRAAEMSDDSFSPDQTVVVGDTSRDVQCARAAGAHAVVVCTGRADQSDLAGTAPDLLLEDFSDPESAVDQIVNISPQT